MSVTVFWFYKQTPSVCTPPNMLVCFLQLIFHMVARADKFLTYCSDLLIICMGYSKTVPDSLTFPCKDKRKLQSTELSQVGPRS